MQCFLCFDGLFFREALNEPYCQCMDSLSQQQGDEKDWQSDAQEAQPVFFRMMPLGEPGIDPHIKKAGENLTLEDAASSPGQDSG